jgi:peptide/nickel transport system permease protein
MRFLCLRVAHGAVVLVGVAVLTFVFSALAPGDALSEMKIDPQLSPETVAALRLRYGLDRPLPLKFSQWVQSVGRGELGFSLSYNRPVATLLWPRARNTLLLTVTATAVAWMMAVPIGAWSASQRGRWGDRVFAGATTALLVVPELVLGLGLLLFAARTGYLPVGGMVSARFDELGEWDRIKDVALHLVLPGGALILLSLPVLVRHVRSSFLEVLESPFIQAVRARGVPPRRILFHHALRVAANPLIALFGLSIAGLLSASLVVEALMSWPGLGPLLLEAIAARDLHVVVGAVMYSTLLLLTGNFIADALLYLSDPRVRSEP